MQVNTSSGYFCHPRDSLELLNIAMSAFRKVYGYAAQLINKVANYRIQMFIQKIIFVQTCRFLNKQN